MVLAITGLSMDIEALADFRLVALHGGFGRASRATGRPKATLSKRVMSLEASLRVRLFDRTSRNLQLTEEGQKLSYLAEQIIDAVDHIREELGATSEEPRGKLRLATPTLFSYEWLGLVAAEFVKRYPEVEIETIIMEQNIEPSAELFDLLIKVNPPPSVGLVGRIFGRDTVRVAASPAALAALDPQQIATGSLTMQAVATTGTTKLGPWKLTLNEHEVQVQAKVKLWLPSRFAVRDAVCAGAGIAELPKSLVLEDFESGRLVDLGPAPVPDVEVWLLYASHRLISRRVSAFASFLYEYFENSIISPKQ